MKIAISPGRVSSRVRRTAAEVPGTMMAQMSPADRPWELRASILPSLVAQISAPYVLVLAKALARVGQGHGPGLQHVAELGDAQSEARVLFHQ